jgi:uncharacterized membrane protein YbhN (UPF0104 family)
VKVKTWLKNNLQLVLRGAGTVLAIILLVVLLSQSGWDEVSAALQQISLTSLGLALGCIILSRLLITARWHVLLRAGGIPIPFKDTAALVFTGLFSNNFLPTTIGGDVVRLAGAMQLGYDRAVCLASIAADRVVNMAGMSLAAPLGLWQVIGVGPLQALALAGFWEKSRDFILKTLQALTLWLKKPSSLFASLAFALLHMICSNSANYVLLHGMGESLALWKVIGLFSLAYFMSLIPVSINGYGLQELSVTFLLSQFGGVSVPVSAAVAVLHRLLMMTVSLPGAFFLPGVLAKMDTKK